MIEKKYSMQEHDYRVLGEYETPTVPAAFFVFSLLKLVYYQDN